MLILEYLLKNNYKNQNSEGSDNSCNADTFLAQIFSDGCPDLTTTTVVPTSTTAQVTTEDQFSTEVIPVRVIRLIHVGCITLTVEVHL